jgi:hypothetical protein
MSGMLLHVGAVIMCSHAGQVQVSPGSPRVTLGGQPAATTADFFAVAGCPFTVGPASQPCLRIDWIVPTLRVKIGGSPAVLSVSTGLGIGPTQAPQGPPVVASSQMRVSGQ